MTSGIMWLITLVVYAWTSQISKRNVTRVFCNHCLKSFCTAKAYDKHLESCRKAVVFEEEEYAKRKHWTKLAEEEIRTWEEEIKVEEKRRENGVIRLAEEEIRTWDGIKIIFMKEEMSEESSDDDDDYPVVSYYEGTFED